MNSESETLDSSKLEVVPAGKRSGIGLDHDDTQVGTFTG